MKTKHSKTATRSTTARTSEKRRALLESYFSNALVLAALLESAQYGIAQ